MGVTIPRTGELSSGTTYGCSLSDGTDQGTEVTIDGQAVFSQFEMAARTCRVQGSNWKYIGLGVYTEFLQTASNPSGAQDASNQGYVS